MTSSVETRDLVKTFGTDIHAVRGVSIRMEPGELVVLVGPSGCGKTTTLRMVAGLERVTSGEILVGDKVVNTVHPSKRGVALVFQNFALYPHKTARENMAFPLESQHVAKDEIRRRVDEVAEMLELPEHLGKLPGQLSGGQQQRVSLGRAIVRNPEVLLLDEPLSNLDARLRVTMRTELKRVQRQLGFTAIYVTHDQVEAMTMGDQIVVMHEGLIAQKGTPQEVYLMPANIPVARTIGSPAMNMLKGKPQTTGDGGVEVKGEGWTLRFSGEGGAAIARDLDQLTGEDVTVGIRPEALDLRDPGATSMGDSGTDGRLGLFECVTAEPLGSETLYNVKVGSDFGRIMRPDTYVEFEEGANVEAFVALGGRVHLFDSASGDRICGVQREESGAGPMWSPYSLRETERSSR